ncbi:hypothetical protein DSM21852_12580 [Methylocystis bryophila]|nr:hypothetical protein DSM21852_12580 [Methylocystis bryophila]
MIRLAGSARPEATSAARTRLGDGLVGEADDVEDDGAAGNLHLHVDGPGLDALESDGCNADDHDLAPFEHPRKADASLAGFLERGKNNMGTKIFAAPFAWGEPGDLG